MTFEELQGLARTLLGDDFGRAMASIEVLADALIEAGHISSEPRSRDELLWATAQWARENAYRRTGRTTRVLQGAIELAENGCHVAVVAVDPEHARDLQTKLAQLTVDSRPLRRVHVRTAAEMAARGVQFDRVLEDHYTIEQRVRRSIP